MPAPTNPLIVQSDKTVLLEVDNPLYEAAARRVGPFLRIGQGARTRSYLTHHAIVAVERGGGGHRRRRDAGHARTNTANGPCRPTCAPIYWTPCSVMAKSNWKSKMTGELWLTCDDDLLITEIEHHKAIKPYIISRPNRRALQVEPSRRGHLKQALIKIGFPGRRFGRLRRGRAARNRIIADARRWRVVANARLSEARRRAVLDQRRSARRERCHRAAVRRGQNDGRHRRDGGFQYQYAHRLHQHRRRAPMDERNRR